MIFFNFSVILHPRNGDSSTKLKTSWLPRRGYVIEMDNSASAETHRLWDYYEAEVYYTCELLPKLKYRIRSWANNCFLYINEYKK